MQITQKNISFTKHANIQIDERKIPKQDVINAVIAPDRVEDDYGHNVDLWVSDYKSAKRLKFIKAWLNPGLSKEQTLVAICDYSEEYGVQIVDVITAINKSK